jgi:NTP pyrophosphatase (non-canonical NTP hydrolase)
MDKRGTGRTAKQLLAAPEGATFIWCNGWTEYARQLCRKHKREDIVICSPREAEGGRPFMTATDVVVDHAVEISQTLADRLAYFETRGTVYKYVEEKLMYDAEHGKMVKALVKPGEAIIASLTPEKADALHMAVGVAGESGELLDAIKKYVIYNKDVDLENVIEELGDLEFYMEGLRQRLGITRQETLAANIVKLSKRYKAATYSDKAAQERADKA